MKGKDAHRAAQLYAALTELPRVRRSLSDRAGKWHDCIHLEMEAAEMRDGETQGSSHYFTVPPDVGRDILDAARTIIRKRLEKLGVKT